MFIVWSSFQECLTGIALYGICGVSLCTRTVHHVGEFSLHMSCHNGSAQTWRLTSVGIAGQDQLVYIYIYIYQPVTHATRALFIISNIL